MIINLRVVPDSKVETLEKLTPVSYKLKIREKAMEGRANIAVIATLSSHFNVKKANIKIIKGTTSRDKVIEILG